MIVEHGSPLAGRIADVVREGFTPRFDEPKGRFGVHPLWSRLNALRTELWLDSGDAESVAEVWSREFVALTTNNTLLNKEIQKGSYDAFIVEAHHLLRDEPELEERERILEIAFMLNARHALSLVERFDAYVSVEEHTDLAHDMEGTVRIARRFHAICPERFIVKIPFTPAGLLATRRAAADGIPVNHTLGFSARQNYVVASLAKPSFVNVFLGRLNSVVADNGLGDGRYVGERAALASQAIVQKLRKEKGIPTRQIAASLRSGEQVRDLAGVDIMTLPTKVAREFLDLGLQAEDMENCLRETYKPGIDQSAMDLGIQTLWDVDGPVRRCVPALAKLNLDAFSPADLLAFFAQRGCADALVAWTPDQIEASREEGKIPRLADWSKLLGEGKIGLDSLMNLAGLNSFIADQAAMDRHVREVLGV